MSKIIFITDYLTSASGGVRFLVDVLTKLSNKFEVKIITGITDYDINIHWLQEKNIEIINLHTYEQRLLPFSQPINVLKFLVKTSTKINKILNDKELVLHFNNHFPCLLAFKVRTSGNTIPLICSLHHLEDISSLPTLVSKIGKRFVQDLAEVNGPYDLIHTVSNFVKREIEKISLINKKKIIVIPPGIELEKYLNISKKAENNEFIMIGRLEPRKHYDHAIFAIKYATRRNPDIKLYIIGDGPLRSTLAGLIRRLSLEKNVFLLGKVNEEVKHSLLSRAQALIHLGYPEGFGIVLIEALATGTPVITYDVAPLNEIILHGKTGYLVEKDNIIELAKIITNFDINKFDSNILRGVAKKYDINVVANMFEKLYESLLRYQ